MGTFGFLAIPSEKMRIYVLLLVSLVHTQESAKILGIFPSPGYSQYQLGNTLLEELVRRGHDVTMITLYSSKTSHTTNYNEIIVPTKYYDDINFFNLEDMSPYHKIKHLYDISFDPTEALLRSTQVQALLKSNASFDLIINEIFLNEAHLGFAHHFKAPFVLLCSLGAVEWVNHLMGNPAPFSLVPNLFSKYTHRMGFWERLQNAGLGLFDQVYKHLVFFPKQNEILHEYFPTAPDLSELMYGASLALLNSHPAVTIPMAHVPNMVEIAGFHIKARKLPDELQEFLDNAADGVVFFSMGSLIKTSTMYLEKIEGILRAFSKLKQKVLMKWENEELPLNFKNVKISKWLPQQDVLAHPNVKVFVTHGGLCGITEAVYHAVPIIGIPICSDQNMNMAYSVSNGFAIKIALKEVSEETLIWALNEMLNNTSYKEMAGRQSRRLRDRAMNPLDTAVFWIEYVLRHHGAAHLKTGALSLKWYQYFLLDVIAFLLLVFCSLLGLTRLLIYRVVGANTNKSKIN